MRQEWLISGALVAVFALGPTACQPSRRPSPAEPAEAEKRAPPIESAPPAIDSAAPQHAGYTQVMSIDELDSAVRAELARRIDEPMAAAGEAYQSTDVVLQPLPWRRFVVAGYATSDRRFWVLCYQHGGIGNHHHLAAFALQDGEAVVLKAGQWLPKRGSPVTLERVVQALHDDEQHADNHW